METGVGGASRSNAEKAGRTPCITEPSNARDTCIGGAGLVEAMQRKQAVYSH